MREVKLLMNDSIGKILDDYLDDQLQKRPLDKEIISSLMKIDEYKKMYYINKGTHLGNPVKKSIRNMIDYYMDKEFDDWLKKNRPRKHNYRLLIVIEECLERNRVVK